MCIRDRLIKVDNSANENIPPLDADFSFYGGIYRQVYLMATSETHFITTDHGSNAVFLSTPSVYAAAATLEIRGSFVNESAQKKQVRISSVVWDKQLRNVAERHLVLSLAAKAVSYTHLDVYKRQLFYLIICLGQNLLPPNGWAQTRTVLT